MSHNVAAAEIVVIGAVSRDHYPEAGILPPEPLEYHPGEKAEWTDAVGDHLDELSRQGHLETHWGGNALNAAIGLASTRTYSIGMVTVRNEGTIDDDVSEYLSLRGICDLSVSTLTHVTSEGAVYRGVDQDGHVQDRMIFGKPRSSMTGVLSPYYIGSLTSGANAVVLASPKSLELTETVLDLTPDDTILAVNPGSSEFAHNADELGYLFRRRRPSLLAGNETEIAQLLGVSEEISPAELALAATVFARNVLCTAGRNGVYYASSTERGAFYAPCVVTPNHLIVDTTGAGDATNSSVISSLLQGVPAAEIPGRAAKQGAAAVKSLGGHSHVQIS
jgi:sugar/nucleoside kinase (ribokinase family)